MSYTSIHRCANDPAFKERINACMLQQAWNNAEVHDGDFAIAVRQAPLYGVDQLSWPTAIDYEEAFEFAVNSDNPNPGGDPAVITDDNILASVQAHWPSNPNQNPVV